MLLVREFTLLATKTLVVVFKIYPIYCPPIAGVDVIEDAEVKPDTLARIDRIHIGFLGVVYAVGF